MTSPKLSQRRSVADVPPTLTSAPPEAASPTARCSLPFTALAASRRVRWRPGRGRGEARPAPATRAIRGERRYGRNRGRRGDLLGGARADAAESRERFVEAAREPATSAEHQRQARGEAARLELHREID